MNYEKKNVISRKNSNAVFKKNKTIKEKKQKIALFVNE